MLAQTTRASPEMMSAAVMDSGALEDLLGDHPADVGNIMIVVLIFQITSIWNDFLIGLTYGGIGTQPMTVILANVVINALGEASWKSHHVLRRPLLRAGYHRRRSQRIVMPRVQFEKIVGR